MKILVTGANGDIADGVGRILIEEFPDAAIDGADARGDWPGAMLFNRMWRVPLANDDDYIERLEQVCEGYDVVVPLSEPEIARLHGGGEEIDASVKAKLMIPQSNLISSFLDKLLTANWLDELGLAPPKTLPLAEAVESDLPVIVKPRSGSGSKGLRLVNTPELLRATQNDSEYDGIAQEYLAADEEEYTCALYQWGDERRCLIMRRRLSGGVTSKAEVVRNPKIKLLLERILDVSKLQGCINVQLRIQDGVPRVFEINPRLSSTVMMRHQMGFQDLVWWIRAWMGMAKKEVVDPLEGTVVFRLSREIVKLPKVEGLVSW